MASSLMMNRFTPAAPANVITSFPRRPSCWHGGVEPIRRPPVLQSRRIQSTSSYAAPQTDSRNTANFAASLWEDFFLTYDDPLISQHTQMIEQEAELKEEVRKMIKRASNLSQQVHLIDVLESVCLDYHFEKEIDDMVSQMHKADVSTCDIRTVALWFYLLRTHGYRVSPDVFERFRDEKGNFAANNPRDLLTLYNAAYMRTHGETILDEVISFTRRGLESMNPCSDESLQHEINCSLHVPLPRRLRIYEVKYYISAYEKDATRNDTILELAKLNANLNRLCHQEELKIISRWWKELELQTRLPYARDRVVECYLWIVGVYFEPCYSRARVILTKMIAIFTLLDDTYDSYATGKECELLTKAVQSWDPKAAHELPEYMKFIFEKILNTFQNIENELAPEERYRVSYIKKTTTDLATGYNKEVKWRDDGYIPATVQEHLQVSLLTGGCHQLACCSFVGMGDIVTKQSLEWVYAFPKIVRALCAVLRLADDLETREREQMINHFASTVDSYMKEHNVSMEVARKKIEELIDEAWKDLNEEWFDPNNTQPLALIMRIVNLTRTMQFIYSYGDAFTDNQALKDVITSLFVEPMY